MPSNKRGFPREMTRVLIKRSIAVALGGLLLAGCGGSTASTTSSTTQSVSTSSAEPAQSVPSTTSVSKSSSSAQPVVSDSRFLARANDLCKEASRARAVLLLEREAHAGHKVAGAKRASAQLHLIVGKVRRLQAPSAELTEALSSWETYVQGSAKAGGTASRASKLAASMRGLGLTQCARL